MFIFGQTKEKVKPEHSTAVETSRLHEIIVYNDDVNTFDHVINTLVEVCDHTLESKLNNVL